MSLYLVDKWHKLSKKINVGALLVIHNFSLVDNRDKLAIYHTLETK